MGDIKLPVQQSLFDTENGVSPDSYPHFARRPASMGNSDISYTNSREILTKATGFMDSYDFTLNPYSGCSFGCTYCYAAFFTRNAEKTESWGYWVTVKENAVALLRKRRAGSLDGKRIYMSSVTDPYQPIERELGLSRKLLEVLAKHHRPKLVVQTRSPAVVKDIDLYRQIENNGGRVQVNMTVTTDDEDVRKAFEPLCPSNPQRLEAIGKLQDADIGTCITMTPLLLVNDSQRFVESLEVTGVQRFIVQPFHWGRGRFLAGTRDKAIEILSEKLNCSKSQVSRRYMERYLKFLHFLKTEFHSIGIPEPGEGKDGFRPPF